MIRLLVLIVPLIMLVGCEPLQPLRAGEMTARYANLVSIEDTPALEGAIAVEDVRGEGRLIPNAELTQALEQTLAFYGLLAEDPETARFGLSADARSIQLSGNRLTMAADYYLVDTMTGAPVRGETVNSEMILSGGFTLRPGIASIVKANYRDALLALVPALQAYSRGKGFAPAGVSGDRES